MFAIKNINYPDGKFQWKHGTVCVEDGRIAGFDKSADHIVDGQDGYLLPGFVDLHTHGCAGFDTCDADPDGQRKMARFYASNGVTSNLATSMSVPEELIAKTFRMVRKLMSEGTGGSAIRGIYMEGPFFNPCKKGAQAEENLRNPDYEMFQRLNRESGNAVKVVAVAPELPGAMEFIQKASQDCVVTIAHTEADFDCAQKAIENGARQTTHTFNAMPPFLHRAPGVIGAALDNEQVKLELICDGIHLHPSVIRMLFKAAGPERLLLISDSMAAAGMPDGQYELGGQAVFVRDGKATLSSGTIAGSSTNLMQCVRNCVKFGIPLAQVAQAASLTPAKVIGLDGEIGSIEIGKWADLVWTDRALNLQKVYLKGEPFTAEV